MNYQQKPHGILTAVVAAACLMFTSSANAAPVTWDANWTLVTNETAIQTLAGYTTFGGVNFNGVNTLINNGSQNVSFTGIAQNASGSTAGITVGSTGFAFQSTGNNSNVASAVGAPQTWGTVLDRVIGDDNNSATIDLSGLTVGDSYYVQFFSNTPDGGINATTTISSGGADSPAFGAHGGGVTRYIIGSFVADATSQSFAITGAEPTFGALVVGVQPQAIPEPSTYALAGMALMGFAGFARWRKK